MMTQAAETVFIEALRRLNPGERARLRRQAGKPLAEAVDALGLFYRLLPHEVAERPMVHERYFLLATLWALGDESTDRNLGASLRRIRTDTNKAGLDRRMEALLDADSEQLSFRLRQIVRLINSQRGGVNWRKLLADLLAWEADDRRVQKTWAMSYFASTGVMTGQGANEEQGAMDADEGHEPAA